MGLFSAFSPLNGGTKRTTYADSQYPFDLDGSFNIVRPATGIPYYPFPVAIGAVQGFMPLADTAIYGMAIAKEPFGPWAGMPQGPLSVVFPNINANIVKQG